MQAAEPDCTLLKPEGFTRALAITPTICCAGERQILLLFVSGSEAREADFSTRGHTIVGAEGKKPYRWSELLGFPNSTRVLVLGREVRGSASPCTVRQRDRRPVSFRLSAFSMAARLPQAGTCCGCQPEGLKFLPAAGTAYA